MLGVLRDFVIEIDASKAGNESKYVNDPNGVPGANGANVGFERADEDVGVFEVVHLRALRDISSGEELLVSYGSHYWDRSDDINEDDDDNDDDDDVIGDENAGYDVDYDPCRPE